MTNSPHVITNPFLAILFVAALIVVALVCGAIATRLLPEPDPEDES